jgi:hypothetical protein
MTKQRIATWQMLALRQIDREIAAPFDIATAYAAKGKSAAGFELVLAERLAEDGFIGHAICIAVIPPMGAVRQVRPQ